MIYSSLPFISLLAFCLLAYSLFKSDSVRLWVLLLSSLAFYAWAGIFDLFIFLSVIGGCWICLFLARAKPKHRRIFIGSGVGLLIAHLAIWKYLPWVLGMFENGVALNLRQSLSEVGLPMGISFFTFQGIAYLIDYKNHRAPFVNLARFALFKSFFAQLIAGPIVRFDELLPQLEKFHRLDTRNISTGISLFSVGLFKKLILSDSLSPLINEVFVRPQSFHRFSIFLALLAFSIQLWADFSGYTDMGRGVARMFNIHLPENFISPYLSLSFSEFWRRWHHTLGRWFRDYVYIPMGGSRGSESSVALRLMATFLLSGLWHGAGLNFLIWGALHGGILIFERFIFGSSANKSESGNLKSLFRPVVVYLIFALSLGFFRAPTLTVAVDVYQSLLFNETGFMVANIIPTVTASLTLMLGLQWVESLIRKGSLNLNFKRVGSIALGVGMGFLFIFSFYFRPSLKASEFIYFRF